MSESETWILPNTPGTRVGVAVLAILAIIGGITTGRLVSGWAIQRLTDAGILEAAVDPMDAIPLSAVPGPPREEAIEFILTEDSSQTMQPQPSPEEERWADLAGNFYTRDFVENFAYDKPGPDGPWVRVSYAPAGQTFSGRLEARGLKPNFAYQIKLRGDYDIDRNSFGVIGGYGRWRGPGKDTNYTDQEFLEAVHKNEWEAYLFFDYFVTDENGDAVREFALDHSLHVLWNATTQRGDDLPEDQLVPVLLDASNPQVYSRPKSDPISHYIWAERERNRYDFPEQLIQLPATVYRAQLVLTEESWHSRALDGGWWATVYTMPVEFAIGPDAVAPPVTSTPVGNQEPLDAVEEPASEAPVEAEEEPATETLPAEGN